MNEVDIPLLRKAVEWAEAEAAKPAELREWEQNYYVIQNPSERVVEHVAGWDARAVQVQKSPACGTCFCVAGKVAFDATGNLNGSVSEDIAITALGISDEQAAQLFHFSNSIADVRRIAEEIAGERL